MSDKRGRSLCEGECPGNIMNVNEPDQRSPSKCIRPAWAYPSLKGFLMGLFTGAIILEEAYMRVEKERQNENLYLKKNKENVLLILCARGLFEGKGVIRGVIQVPSQVNVRIVAIE